MSQFVVYVRKDVIQKSDETINHIKPSGNYVPPALTINNSTFCIYEFLMILIVSVNRYFSLNNINQ
jgi:hypothetical protein